MSATLSDAAQAKVREYLTGCQAVREGLFAIYFIVLDEKFNGVIVTVENVDEVERLIREGFAEAYPEAMTYAAVI